MAIYQVDARQIRQRTSGAAIARLLNVNEKLILEKAVLTALGRPGKDAFGLGGELSAQRSDHLVNVVLDVGTDDWIRHFMRLRGSRLILASVGGEECEIGGVGRNARVATHRGLSVVADGRGARGICHGGWHFFTWCFGWRISKRF